MTMRFCFGIFLVLFVTMPAVVLAGNPQQVDKNGAPESIPFLVEIPEVAFFS